MRFVAAWITLVVLGTPFVVANHLACTPGGADPNTYLVIDSVIDLDGDGVSEIFYQEERDTGLPPVPLTGFLLANGSWTWEEANGLPGLQRGWDWNLVQDGVCPIGEELLYPFCTNDFEEPLSDETCGHGPDNLVI